MVEFVVLIAVIVAATLAFVWMALGIRKVKLATGAYQNRIDAVQKEAEKVFTDEFREELKNRGRLYFEKIINENAMFLKQDLGLTASQLNEYMQTSLRKVLNEEFDKYKLSIQDAKEAALGAITKTQTAMDQQREAMQKELKTQLEQEKQRRIAKLDEHLVRVANQYILDVLANEVDLGSQGEYIFAALQTRKNEIIKDFEDGS